jgi:glycerophosphoryl diester phosphodiesterase
LTHPVVIAHRGTSGERPEHTESAYRLAIAQGTDAVEPDLVLTRDGVLICRHENELSETTDITDRPAFAARRTTKTIDGKDVSGWFSEDFTLAELKTLRCRERLPHLRPASAAWNDREPVLTFGELLDIVGEAGRTIAVYAEIKHARYFDDLGLSHDAPLLAALRARGWTGADAPMLLQSFETGSLRRLAGLTGVRLVQLVAPSGGPPDAPGATFAEMMTDAGLARIAGYAAAISVEKTLVMPRTPDGGAAAPTDIVARAHAQGLAVNVWTFRPENRFLPKALRRGDDPAAHGDLETELRQVYALGVDGVFCDFPAVAVAARQPA